jgi:signal transduction histidine kinase
LCLLGVLLWFSHSGGVFAQPAATRSGPRVAFRAASVNGKNVSLRRNGTMNLGSSPQNVFFDFGPTNDSSAPAMRVRYRLEGEDASWRDGPGEMLLAVRFYNSAGDQIGQNTFKVMGESAGWNGSVTNSPLTHRREVVVVPDQAARLWIVLSSGAGPPATVGVYVVANLTVSRFTGSSQPMLLMESPLDFGFEEESSRNPPGWTRDGNHSSMAKIVTLSENPVQKAFAIQDDDALSHAEWHNIMESAPAVTPGEHVVVEWNEMFSMGMGNFGGAHYDTLKEGTYQMHVAEFDLLGRPCGAEQVFPVIVPRPFWRTSWFWSIVAMLAVSLSFAWARYVVWRRMRLEMLRLKSQQALEKERLRIAQDIHDDLGARVTEISLISALAKTKPAGSASADFDRISNLSRELVSALYETVWAVNPENDNLDALGNYLCQITNKLCEQAQLPCRFEMLELPAAVQVSSQTRHNIIMAVKEAVHNIIKHAKATEVTLSAAYDGRALLIAIRDNGCGFAEGSSPAGNGLTNIRRRVKTIGGHCSILSTVGKGTLVEMRLELPSVPNQNGVGDMPAQQHLQT